MPAPRSATRPRRRNRPPKIPIPKPRGWKWRECEDVALEEWILVLRHYVPPGTLGPVGAAPLPEEHVGHVEPVMQGDVPALTVVGPNVRGRPELPRWYASDDLHPVLGFAALMLAWKMRRTRESTEVVAADLGCEADLIRDARQNPSGRVQDILRAFRSEPISERTLKKYRALWRLTSKHRAKLYGERRVLLWAVRAFLVRCPADILPPDVCVPPCDSRQMHHSLSMIESFRANRPEPVRIA